MKAPERTFSTSPNQSTDPRMRPAFLLLQLLLLCSTPLTAQNLSQVWKLENTFSMPESATLDSNAEFIFVSNVNEYAKDGNGFISRVSIDGTRVELRWLDGLDSPTGLAVYNGLLYFADFDSLVVADLATAQILNRYPAPDANPSLNDVAISAVGDVFVSGSASNSIYHLDNGALINWRHDDNLLLQANGLYIDGDHLIQGGKSWNIFDRHSANLAAGTTALTPMLEGIDGITQDVCGDYLLTLIADERIWHIAQDGSALPFSNGPLNGIDIHGQAGLLVVPHVGGDLTLFRQDIDSCVK